MVKKVSEEQTLFVCEYENGYESDYESIYDQNFVYYDEENFDEECDDEGFYHDHDADDDTDDAILEEIPFVYCPTRDEVGVA